MIRGVTVTVVAPNPTKELDRFGEPVMGTPTSTTVDDVLVAPLSTDDLRAPRADGDTVDLTLHFPKSWTAPLRGCSVTLPEPWAGTYRVVGEPMPYIGADTPGKWHMPVEVARVDG